MNNEITAADVVAFLAAQAAKLADAVGEPYTFVAVEVLNRSHGEPRVEWKTYVNGDQYHTAPTLDKAITQAVSCASPTAKAAAKRAEAARLIAEADSLAPIAEPDRDEPDYDAPKLLTPMENYLQNDEHHVR